MFDSFLYQHDLTNLVKEGTCYKNPGNLSHIDLYLTNTQLSSQSTSSVFTGFSDFHKLVLTVFNTTFVKCKLKEFFYRDYKHFNHESFEKDLKCALSTFEKINYQEFDKTFIETLNKHAPLKKKSVRANQPPYMTKALRKAIMRRYELETKYFKLKTNDTLKAYKKQKNYYSRLYKKERKKFFENLNLPFVVDNKKFSKLVKPLFNEKGGGVSNEVVLLEKDKILRDDNEVPKEFHSYFNSIVSSLGITENEYTIQKNIPSSEPIDKAIMLFRFHPSILLIKSKINTSHKFSFTEIETDDVDKEIRSLNSKKSGTQNDIPAKILKKCESSTAPVLQKLFNKILRTGNFPFKLKLADITPVFKKNNPLEKGNYIPASVLPVVSKIFERIMQKQVTIFTAKPLVHCRH